MQYSSPGNRVLNVGIASMHRTAYGLFVVASNGAHLFGRTVPPGLYFNPARGKPWHCEEVPASPAVGTTGAGPAVPPLELDEDWLPHAATPAKSVAAIKLCLPFIMGFNPILSVYWIVSQFTSRVQTPPTHCRRTPA